MWKLIEKLNKEVCRKLKVNSYFARARARRQHIDAMENSKSIWF